MTSSLGERGGAFVEPGTVERVFGIGRIASTRRPYDALLVVERSVR